MKTAAISFAFTLVGAWLLAADPIGSPSANKGNALLLDNDQLIEGEIRRDGNRVIIQRGDSETVIPASRVVEILADRKAAVQVMRERSNRRDPDERLRLIRWCMENNLRDEAIAETEDLLKFRPDDAKLKDLLLALRQLPQVTNSVRTIPPKTPLDKVVDVAAPDYNPEAFAMFASRVQPILMNVCIGCHGSGKGGNYSLVRSDEGGSRNAAIVNLAATLKHINRLNPSESPFLVKSVSAHGNASKPPLRDRAHPAYSNLEAWVASAVGPEVEESPALKPIDVEKPQPKVSTPIVHFGETSQSKPRPEPQTEAKDPFDPAIFNGTIQPKKK